MKNVWFVLSAGSLALGGFLAPSPLAGLAFTAAIAALLMGLRSAHRYDLSELNRLHERAQTEDADTIVCAHCGEAYAEKALVCPGCGRAP
jgi:hypothetical protein